MRKIFVFFLMAFITFSSFGQEPVLKKEISYSGEGTIFLEDGSKVTGEIVHNRTNNGVIWLYTEGKKRPKKYKVKNITGFTIGDTIYFEKIKTTAGTKLARCINDKNSKIKLYDATYQSPMIKGGNAKSGYLHPTYIDYMVIFPGMKRATSIKDLTMSKKRVAKYVNDCPELSNKILNKEKGYKIGKLIPVSTLLKSYINIANEYENCK